MVVCLVAPMPAEICCSPRATLNWISGSSWMFLNQRDSITCLQFQFLFLNETLVRTVLKDMNSLLLLI